MAAMVHFCVQDGWCQCHELYRPCGEKKYFSYFYGVKIMNHTIFYISVILVGSFQKQKCKGGGLEKIFIEDSIGFL